MDFYGGPVPFFAFNGDSPPMPFDDFPDNGKTESASLFLCRKEWIKYLFYIFLVDPLTGIVNLYPIRIFLFYHLDRDRTTIRGSLNSVEKDVQKCSVKEFLVRV